MCNERLKQHVHMSVQHNSLFEEVAVSQANPWFAKVTIVASSDINEKVRSRNTRVSSVPSSTELQVCDECM